MFSVYRIFRYLQKNLSKIPGRMCYDGNYYPVNEEYFKDSVVDTDTWKDFYPDAQEALPGKYLEPLGKPVYVKAYVDANAVTPIGVGQTWQDFTGSRSGSDTAYQNTAGRPIMVIIYQNFS